MDYPNYNIPGIIPGIPLVYKKIAYADGSPTKKRASRGKPEVTFIGTCMTQL